MTTTSTPPAVLTQSVQTLTPDIQIGRQPLTDLVPSDGEQAPLDIDRLQGLYGLAKGHVLAGEPKEARKLVIKAVAFLRTEEDVEYNNQLLEAMDHLIAAQAEEAKVIGEKEAINVAKVTQVSGTPALENVIRREQAAADLSLSIIGGMIRAKTELREDVAKDPLAAVPEPVSTLAVVPEPEPVIPETIDISEPDYTGVGPAEVIEVEVETVVETPEPIVEPVVETPEPVVETPEPVVETPEPVVEPVVETPEPVVEVETPEPVVEVETPEPVVEPVVETPVVEPVAPVATQKPQQTIHASGGFGGINLPDSFKAGLPDGQITKAHIMRNDAVFAPPPVAAPSVIRTLGDPVNGLRVVEEGSLDLLSMECMVMPSMMQMLVRRSGRQGRLRAERAICPNYPVVRNNAVDGKVTRERHSVEYPIKVYVGNTLIVDNYLFNDEAWRLLTVFRAPYGVWYLEADLNGDNPDALTTRPPDFVGKSGFGARIRLLAFLRGESYRKLMPKSGKIPHGGVELGGPRETAGFPFSVYEMVAGQMVSEVGGCRDKLPPSIFEGWRECVATAWKAGGYNPRDQENPHTAPDNCRQLTVSDFRNTATPEPTDPVARQRMLDSLKKANK